MSSTVKFKFDLGITARDRVTGIEGTLDARSEWLNGCLRYSLQPKAKEANPDKSPDSYWFDEGQLEKVDDGLNATNPVRKTRTGGPKTSSASARM